MDTATFLVGSIGAMVALIAFLLNQSDKIPNDSFLYDFLNFLGGTLLFVYAYLLGSVPFMVINAVWGIVSLKDLFLKDNFPGKK